MGSGLESWFRKIYTATQEFLDEKGIETQEEARTPRLHRWAHFWLLVYKSFVRNRCPVRATALAYTTLLALVPLLALCVSLSTSLFKESYAEQRVVEYIDRLVAYVAPQLDLVAADEPEAAGPTAIASPPGEGQTIATNAAAVLTGRKTVARRISDAIGNIRSGTLGATGVLGLIVVAILLLSNIEATFNDIWGVTEGRGWFARVVQYWAAISLGPIALFAVLALTSGSHLQTTRQWLDHFPLITGFLFKFLPLALISLSFAGLYKLVPNTPVDWSAALLGGLAGGSMWMANNVFQARAVSGVVNASAIYGPLASLPIFLAGLYISWLILLFGAQVAYAVQNRQVYLQERKADSVNQRGREFVALRLMTFVAQRFAQHAPPPTLLNVAEELGVPSRLVGRIVHPLVQARLLVEVAVGESTALVPGRPIEAITCYDILRTLRTGGGIELATKAEPSRDFVRQEFLRIGEVEQQAARETTLQDLLHRMEAHPGAADATPFNPAKVTS
jgi:membrane protein